MRLQTFFQDGTLKFGMDAIAADEELATHIQDVLIWLKFLDPPSDGKFGPISSEALRDFQNAFGDELKDEEGFLGKATAKKLIETEPSEVPQPETDLSKDDLPAKIIGYMLENFYRISTGPKKYNIVYVEGMDENGDLNDNEPNSFNDRRMVIEIPDKIPVLVNHWQATTEPGTHYTMNPISAEATRLGAARIAFGQYKAWQVGTHYGGGSEPHEALVQVSNISIYRDKNKDFKRTGDKLYTGVFDIDQHYGFDYPYNDISYAGAGCLVGRRREGHREFMEIVKQDKRYQLNESYRFLTTIISGQDLYR
jgi:Putative peptidoglycan binding domain